MNALSQREFSFHSPTRIVFGPGSLNRLADLIEEQCGTGAPIFLVTGRQSLKAQGALSHVLESLGRFRTTLYDGALPFPSAEQVDGALEVCRQAGPEVVVSIGGGSALDLGKLVAVLMPNPGPSMDYGTGSRRIQNPGLPFIAAPTTSGSSSEVTESVALWRGTRRRRTTCATPSCFPP